MAELVLSSRTVGVTIAAGIVAIAVAATIGYNVGFGSGTKVAPPNISQTNSPGAPGTNNTTPSPATNTPPSTSPVPAEIPVSGQPVAVAGKTILAGTVSKPLATGFTLDVTTQVLNTATRRLTPRTTSYQVVLNKATKIVEQTSIVTVPYQGATPQVTSTTKTVDSGAIQADSQVTVTTNDSASSLTITALEVRLTSVVQKQ